MSPATRKGHGLRECEWPARTRRPGCARCPFARCWPSDRFCIRDRCTQPLDIGLCGLARRSVIFLPRFPARDGCWSTVAGNPAVPVRDVCCLRISWSRLNRWGRNHGCLCGFVTNNRAINGPLPALPRHFWGDLTSRHCNMRLPACWRNAAARLHRLCNITAWN